MEWQDWEYQEFDECEKEIEANVRSFWDVAERLLIIKTKKYYLMEYKSFEEYCVQRWGFNRQLGYRLLNLAEIKSDTGETLNARQVAELVKAPKEKRKDILDEAKKSGKVTVQSLKEAVTKSEKPKDLVADREGNVVPEWLESVFTRAPQEVQPLLGILKQLTELVNKYYKEEDILWKRFPINPFKTETANLRRAIRFAMPHVVCPYCQGEGGIGGDCKACKGDGWLNKSQWERVPEDMK